MSVPNIPLKMYLKMPRRTQKNLEGTKINLRPKDKNT